MSIANKHKNGNSVTKTDPIAVGQNGKKILSLCLMATGHCRQGQYYISLKDIISNLKLKDIGILSMDDETSFDDLGSDFFLKGWLAITIADIIHDIESIIQTLAVDKTSALEILNEQFSRILFSLENENRKGIFRQLKETAKKLTSIKI